MVSKENVYKIAKLARLSISEDEASRYATDLSKILGYVERLESVDVGEVEPMTHVHGSKNVYRPDKVVQSMPISDVLKNAPDVNGQFFRVPLIREQNTDN